MDRHDCQGLIPPGNNRGTVNYWRVSMVGISLISVGGITANFVWKTRPGSHQDIAALVFLLVCWRYLPAMAWFWRWHMIAFVFLLWVALAYGPILD